jgi:hypothetical protein
MEYVHNNVQSKTISTLGIWVLHFHKHKPWEKKTYKALEEEGEDRLAPHLSSLPFHIHKKIQKRKRQISYL